MTQRVRDFVLYIVIGLIVGLVAILWATLSPQTANYESVKVVGLILGSAFVFGYFLSDSVPFFRRKFFWVFTSLLFVTHVVIFVILLKTIHPWKLSWFCVVYPELVLFAILRDFVYQRWR